MKKKGYIIFPLCATNSIEISGGAVTKCPPVLNFPPSGDQDTGGCGKPGALEVVDDFISDPKQ